MKFSFNISTDPPCIYNKTHYTYSSTIISLILILIYNLYVVRNLEILFATLSNFHSLATSIFDPVLGQGTTTTFSSGSLA